MKQSFGYIMGMLFMLVLIVALPQIVFVVMVFGLVGWFVYATGGSGMVFGAIILILISFCSWEIQMAFAVILVLLFIAGIVAVAISFKEESDKEKAEWRKEYEERCKKREEYMRENGHEELIMPVNPITEQKGDYSYVGYFFRDK